MAVMEAAAIYTAFAGTRQLAMGSLRDVLPALKQRFDQDRSQLVLVFEVETGRQVDFDLRGSLEEVLEREAPLQISNVMFFCPVTQKPTRIGIRVLDDGRRVRFSKKSNETVE